MFAVSKIKSIMETKKVKIQIKSRFGKILFEYESENNTVKETLRNADLRNADLRNAVLSGAVLSGADLRNAVLSGADLSGAVLSGAVLSGADLRNADLSGAVLSGADLRNAVLPVFCKWSVSMIEGKIRIGCKIKTIEEWDAWFASDETYDTPRDSEDFKRIQANYIAIREYCKFMNS